jgi:hypothetical protein
MSFYIPFCYVCLPYLNSHTSCAYNVPTAYRAVAFWPKYILSHQAVKHTTTRSPTLLIALWRTL